nr:hypothetical protein [Tanacetum cinerariifolium]
MDLRRAARATSPSGARSSRPCAKAADRFCRLQRALLLPRA